MPPRALLALICQTPASRFVKRGEFFSATVRPSSQFSANLKVVELLFLPLLLINQTLFCFRHFFFRMLTSENMISIKRQHKKTHSGETLYKYTCKCNHCNYTCVLTSQLQNHMLFLTREIPFKCNQCGKAKWVNVLNATVFICRQWEDSENPY